MSKITRIRCTPDQRRDLIAEQAASGMSQEAFCEHKRLALKHLRELEASAGINPWHSEGISA